MFRHWVFCSVGGKVAEEDMNTFSLFTDKELGAGLPHGNPPGFQAGDQSCRKLELSTGLLPAPESPHTWHPPPWFWDHSV